MGIRQSVNRPRAPRARRGLTLIEVIVALSMLGGAMLGLGMFSARLSQETSRARMRITASQLADDRVEVVKSAPRYSAIESLYVKTESSISGYPGFARQTSVTRIGGTVSDTIDYKVVTVQVTNPQMTGAVKKTTVIAPF